MMAQVVAILLLILGRDNLQQFFFLGQVALWVVLGTALFSAFDYYYRFTQAETNLGLSGFDAVSPRETRRSNEQNR